MSPDWHVCVFSPDSIALKGLLSNLSLSPTDHPSRTVTSDFCTFWWLPELYSNSRQLVSHVIPSAVVRPGWGGGVLLQGLFEKWVPCCRPRGWGRGPKCGLDSWAGHTELNGVILNGCWKSECSTCKCQDSKYANQVCKLKYQESWEPKPKPQPPTLPTIPSLLTLLTLWFMNTTFCVFHPH